MATCTKCGMPVRFRFIDGRCTPIHPQGGCKGSIGALDGQMLRDRDSGCVKAHCPTCGDPVYFVRYNGGSVYLDPPLGAPWARHPCMPDKARTGISEGGNGRNWLSADAMSEFAGDQCIITGVATVAEVGRGRKHTILTVSVAQPEELVLLVRGGADFLLGKPIIFRTDKSVICSVEAIDRPFKVEGALFTPDALRSVSIRSAARPFSLPPTEAQAQLILQSADLSKSGRKAWAKYRVEQLAGEWKPHELIHIIPLLSGRKRDEAIHRAAVLILEAGLHHRNFNGVVELAKTLHPPRRKLLAQWFRTHSPVDVDLQRRVHKMLIRRSEDGKVADFDLTSARANPFYAMTRQN